jgi:RNA polymerase sigma factor (sigma-70 family)
MDGTTRPVSQPDRHQDVSREHLKEYLDGRPAAIERVDRWIREELASGFPVLRGESDDLCQTVHGKLYKALGSGAFRHESSLRTFVSRVTRYTAVDQIRRRYRDPLWSPRAEIHDVAWQQSPYRSVASLERGALLKQILLHTATECRRLWRLAFVERLSYDEIARTLDVAPGTVKSRMSRCRERVMALLRRADG